MATTISGSSNSSFGGTIDSTGIDTTGNITCDANACIGGTDTSRDLVVVGNTNDPVHFKMTGDSADYARIMFDDGTTDNIGEIRYHFGDDDMRFRTNGSERLRILSSGGITFNGDTAAANALDDYEEGTWAVGVSSGTGGSITTTQNSGYYTKVGNMVTVWFQQLSWGAKTGLGGSLRITGLPFAVGTTRSAGSIGGSPPGTFTSINRLFIAVDPGGSFIWLVSKATTNNTYTHMGNANIGSSGTIYGMTLTYRV